MIPFVSVIIPVYNAEKYLRECLDSVVGQSLRDIEIICVDDGSTDGSPAVLAEYAACDLRVRVITQENAGVGSARNVGIRAARGEFVAFIDPDDLLPDESVYEALYLWAKEKCVRVCGGGVCSLANDGKRYFPDASWGSNVEQAFPRDGLMRFSDWQFDYGFYRYIFERRLLLDNGIFFPPYIRYQDPVFCARALEAAGTFYALRRPTYVFRDWHAPDYTDRRRVCDQLRGVRDQLKFSRERGRAKLHWLQIHRLFEELKPHVLALVKREKNGEDIPADQSAIDLLKEIDGRADVRLARRYKPETPYYSVGAEFLRPEIKVSVVIPVHNVEKYLRECLDSVVAQTLREIEIICVDDGSTDSFPQILEEYAAKDPRIRVIRQNNLGTSQTRKNGVSASRGAFLMFLDGDDELVPTACEKAFSAASRSGADIVQFGTEIVNVAGVPHERIAMNEKMLEPFLGGIERENLVEACWVKKKFSGNLWNKIFRGDLARKAFDCVENGYFPRAQDWYAFFIIAYLSRSYFGIAEKLYRYNFGIGVIGGNKLTMKKFDAILSQKKVFEALKSFLGKRGDGRHYQNSLETIRNIFLGQSLHAWQSKLSKEDAVVAFPKLIDAWGFEEVLVSFAKSKWNSDVDFFETLAAAFILNSRKAQKRIKTIAFYYRCIANGGAQRVVADLCNLFAEKKNGNGAYAFNVVCITDAEFSGVKGDYPLSTRVARAYLPAYAKSSCEKYRDRLRAWHEIISKHEVDAVVSGLWTEPVTFWDALSVKGHPRSPYFLTHSHSYNGIPWLWEEAAPKRIDALYRVSDGVVALSDCDRRHVEKINPRVRTIVNPLAFDPRKIGESSREANSIVWCGRISKEKRPLDVVRMMKKVVAEIPEAKLRLVGGGDENLMHATATLVHELGLEKNVELVGFTHDVAAYYSKASVFVSTSEYEGFPLTFGEAMAHGVPIVSYEMPWLTLVHDGRGIVPVERLNPDALAREVIRLLKNPAEARGLGMRGREQIIEINDVDIVAEWENLFDEIAGVPVKKRELSREERAEFDAINERFIGVFRRMREERLRARSGVRGDSRESAVGVSGSDGNVAFPPALPRFVVRLGALFILNKAARKRWRERHMDLTPRDGIDVNAHPELRRDSALKRFAVRASSLFIFSKKKRKAFRARHLKLRPRDGVDVRALSSQELARLREEKRSESVLWRVFDALVPATRGKIVHMERHLRRAAEEQTRILLDELRRSREETNRRFSVLEREAAAARERFASLERRLTETQAALSRKADTLHDAALLKILAAKHAAESANVRAAENATALSESVPEKS